MLSRLLAHPATRGLDLDSPETTAVRREIVRSKPFLRAVYEEWYQLIARRLPNRLEPVLELGAGGGFMEEVIPGLITSDVFKVPGIDRVEDARDLQFEDESLAAIVMTNVLHHIPQVDRFLNEAERVLIPGGRVIMIEPWNTGWSRFVHRHLHTEPMVTDTDEWSFPESGPLSGANAALPWIVASRDREQLERRFPTLRVTETAPLMPFRYILSGGVSMRSLQPGWTFKSWKAFEEASGLDRRMAVFAVILIEKSES